MKENSFLSWWCFKPWQIALDAIGAVFAVVLCIQWDVWTAGQRMFMMMGILIPIHVFEEWWWPAGFHWQYNLVNGSESPDRYPMCRLSDMVTNTVACVVFALFGIIRFTAAPFLLAMTAFCLLEVIIHSTFGILMLRRYRAAGKHTFYGPGSFTAYAGFLPLFVWGIILLWERGTSGMDWVWGIGLLFGLLLGLVILPERLLGSKDSPYVFPSAGYFEKFLGKDIDR